MRKLGINKQTLENTAITNEIIRKELEIGAVLNAIERQQFKWFRQALGLENFLKRMLHQR